MRTHETPNQRTHWGFITSEPAYRAHFAERGDPLAWWQEHHQELPLLSALARYVREHSEDRA